MKKCSYLRIRLTNRCNLSCSWCHNEGGNIRYQDELSVANIEKTVRLLRNLGYRKIKLAGGEPTVRKDLVELVYALCDIPDIDLSLISNGTLLTDVFILELQHAGLKRINLSINTFQEGAYRRFQGGNRYQLYTALASIDSLIRLGMEKPKINFLYLGPQSDNELHTLMDRTKRHKIKIALLNILPGYEANRFSFISTATLIDHIFSMEVKDVHCINDPNSFSVLSFTMKNGAILEIGHHFVGHEFVYKSCKECAVQAFCLETVFSHRLTPEGFLQPCLLRQDNCFDLRSFQVGLESEEETTSKLNSYFQGL